MSFEEALKGYLDHIEQAIKDAGGDVIEALHGHKCGPDCWHHAAPCLGNTPEVCGCSFGYVKGHCPMCDNLGEQPKKKAPRG